MSKSAHVARQIQAMIQRQALKPGDTLPSERAIAAQLGVAYTTVRLANDYLIRQGVVERRHGRGTYVAQPSGVEPARKLKRLGLLYVDMHDQESPSLRDVTFQAQRAAAEDGYELIIAPLETDDILHGREPEMLAGRSVDGVALYGRVRDHHLRYLRDTGVPYMVLGNRPISDAEPQARVDAEGTAYQITRELLKAGRRPVWYDVDLDSKQYHTGQEQFQGYMRASHEFGDGNLHVCSLRIHHMVDAVQRLCRAGLKNAAIVTQDWAAPLLVPTLSMRTPDWEQLLIVPPPGASEPRPGGPNVVQWVGQTDTNPYAGLGVRSLLDALGGRAPCVRSVTVGTQCQLLSLEPQPRLSMALSIEYRTPGQSSPVSAATPPRQSEV